MRGEPRTIAALSRREPRARVLIVGSADYILAMEDDLLAARAVLSSQEQLLVISSGGKLRNRPISHHVVETDARLQSSLRGSRQSLAVRIAEKALERADRHELVPARVRRSFTKIADASPELPAYNRVRMTDEEVRVYVERSLRHDPSVSHTSLLRQLRSDGRACEQGRFRDLFASARSRS